MFKKWILTERNSRLLFFKSELKKNLLKSLLVSQYNYFCKIYFSKCLWSLGKFSSISFNRNYCVVSYKTKSVFRRFKMVRHLCKKYASFGLLVGMRKSSF